MACGSKSSLLPVFRNKLLCLVYGCFCATMAELSSCNTDRMARKARSIYSLALHRRTMPTPVMHRNGLCFVEGLDLDGFFFFFAFRKKPSREVDPGVNRL